MQLVGQLLAAMLKSVSYSCKKKTDQNINHVDMF